MECTTRRRRLNSESPPAREQVSRNFISDVRPAIGCEQHRRPATNIWSAIRGSARTSSRSRWATPRPNAQRKFSKTPKSTERTTASGSTLAIGAIHALRSNVPFGVGIATPAICPLTYWRLRSCVDASIRGKVRCSRAGSEYIGVLLAAEVTSHFAERVDIRCVIQRREPLSRTVQPDQSVPGHRCADKVCAMGIMACILQHCGADPNPMQTLRHRSLQ